MTAPAMAPLDIAAGETPTAVYRCFGADGTLLYVGVTDYVRGRFQAHSHTSGWWHLTATRTITWYGSRRAALGAEAAAILTEAPVHNVQRLSLRKPTPIGEAIQVRREEAGLSRAELGGAIGKSVQLIQKIETGERKATPQVTRAVADALRIPLAALVIPNYDEIRDPPGYEDDEDLDGAHDCALSGSAA